MAYTQTDLDTLDAAIASGERRVRVNGREVEYRSVAEMMQARAHVATAIAAAAAGSQASSLRRFNFATLRE